MAYDFNSLTKQAPEATNRDGFYTDFGDVDPSKLHQITELTEWMRTKAKGSDVREVIAQLFERTWVESIKEGNANLEVAQARGSYPNLKSRLDNVDNKQQKTTEQLAQKANKDEVTSVMTPKGTLAYASLPTSGNQVGWYYYCPDGDGTHGAGNYVWNGTSWFFGGTGDEGYNLLKKDLGDLKLATYLSQRVSTSETFNVVIDKLNVGNLCVEFINNTSNGGYVSLNFFNEDGANVGSANPKNNGLLSGNSSEIIENVNITDNVTSVSFTNTNSKDITIKVYSKYKDKLLESASKDYVEEKLSKKVDRYIIYADEVNLSKGSIEYTVNVPDDRNSKKIIIKNNSSEAGYFGVNFGRFHLGHQLLLDGNSIHEVVIPSIYYGEKITITNTNGRNATFSMFTDLEENLYKNKEIRTIIVDSKGEGDFNTIEEAIAHAKYYYDVANEDVTIFIKNGVYEVQPTNSYPFSPLNKGANRISIIGESREGVIIKCTNTASTQSKVMDIGGKCTIANLSIYCLNDGYTSETDLGHNPYCIHNDTTFDSNTEYETVVENCYLYSECHAPIGAGLKNNQKQIYRNVETVANGIVGSGFYVHAPSTPDASNCSLVVDNVTAITKNGRRAIDLGNVDGSLPYSQIPTTIRKSVFITNGPLTGAEGFKSSHQLTNDSALNNLSDLNY